MSLTFFRGSIYQRVLEIKRFRERMKKVRRGFRTYMRLYNRIDAARFNNYDGRVIIDAGRWTTKNLTAAREQLRQIFRTWTDTVNHVWEGAADRMIVSYRCPNRPVEIWLWFPADDVPPGILKSNCRIIELDERRRRVVCDV